LTVDELAVLLGWSQGWTMWRRHRLTRDGLVRLLDESEVRDTGRLGLTELTADGFRLVASRLGLPPGAAVQHLGLGGGGPDQPIGQRSSLLRTLPHTRGVNALFVGLCRTARTLATTGLNDALLEWRSAAACSRGRVRPDGYGVYQHRGEAYGFFLEYDRGTMSGRDYRAKFAAYSRYRASGRYDQDYAGFPTVLVVTAEPAAEERIARALRAVSLAWPARLPVLLTCAWRIEHTSAYGSGWLGAIWREAGSRNRVPCFSDGRQGDLHVQR
jgi:hypothetical protein